MEIEWKIHHENKDVLYSVLTSLAIWQKPKTYLEIGVNEGKSLKTILDDCRPDFITLCDIWGNMYGGAGRGGHEHIEKILKTMNYKNDVEFIDGDSRVELPKKIGELEYDLILVDGDHSYNGAWIDLWNAWKMLKVGGVIVFDDLLHPEHKYLLDCADQFTHLSGAEVLYRNIKKPHGVIVWTKKKK